MIVAIATGKDWEGKTLTPNKLYTTVISRFRTINNERSSSVGRTVRNYVEIKLSKDETGGGGKALVFLVSDKAMVFKNNQIDTIEQ